MHAAATIEPTVRFHLKTCLAHTNEKKATKNTPGPHVATTQNVEEYFVQQRLRTPVIFNRICHSLSFFPVARPILIKPDERNQASRKTPAMQSRAFPPIRKRPLHSSCAVHLTHFRATRSETAEMK